MMAPDPQLGGSESVSTQTVGLVEKIGADCFMDFDYIALGHIHSPQCIGRDEIRYVGSPLKYSLSEASNNKFATIVDLGGKGDAAVKLEPLYPMRDLRHIKGRMRQLLKEENFIAPEDFIYATLTDEDFIDNVMGIFQQHYPNTIRIEYDNSHTKELQQMDITQITVNKTFGEMISDFYQLVYGCEISEEELKRLECELNEKIKARHELIAELKDSPVELAKAKSLEKTAGRGFWPQSLKRAAHARFVDLCIIRSLPPFWKIWPRKSSAGDCLKRKRKPGQI